MLLDYLKRGVETEASQENEVHEIDRVNMEINLTDVTQTYMSCRKWGAIC